MIDECEKKYRAIFGERLDLLTKEYAEIHGITLNEVVKNLGFSYRSLRFYVKGQAVPDLSKIHKITEFFKVDFDWLIGQTEYRNSNARNEAFSLGLTEKSYRNLRALASNVVPYSMKPSSFNPCHCGYQLDPFNIKRRGRYYTTDVRYFGDESNQKIKDSINAKSLIATINFVIEDKEFCQLVDSYLHSVWSMQEAPPNSSLEDLDCVIVKRMESALDDARWRIFRDWYEKYKKEVGRGMLIAKN